MTVASNPHAELLDKLSSMDWPGRMPPSFARNASRLWYVEQLNEFRKVVTDHYMDFLDAIGDEICKELNIPTDSTDIIRDAVDDCVGEQVKATRSRIDG